MTHSDHINGYISQLGAEYGVPTPLNDSLVDLVRFKVSLGHRATKEVTGERQAARQIHSERFGKAYMKVSVRRTRF